jgi:hypothetical protein
VHCSPLRIELVFNRILPENRSFQGEEKPILFQIGLFIGFEETHVSLQRQPFVLEA